MRMARGRRRLRRVSYRGAPNSVVVREWITSVPLSLKEAIPLLIEALALAQSGHFELTSFQNVL